MTPRVAPFSQLEAKLLFWNGFTIVGTAAECVKKQLKDALLKNNIAILFGNKLELKNTLVFLYFLLLFFSNIQSLDLIALKILSSLDNVLLDAV